MGNKFKTIPMTEEDSWLLKFLYKHPFGRFILKGMIQPPITKIAGLYLNSTFSKCLIKYFIKKNNLTMQEYKPVQYTSFNHFFLREICETARPFSEEVLSLAAPCDGKVTVYPIDEASIFRIKGSEYSLSELLDSTELAAKWRAGCAVIFRLTPDDYHHYYFIDEGEITTQYKIPGLFHTVRPIAIHNEPVFSRNSREVTLINTRNFGEVAQVEVGALMVGKIKNLKDDGSVARFEKKGWFEFGGSTVILLFQKNSVMIDDEIKKNTENRQETIVQLGQKIGQKENNLE